MFIQFWSCPASIITGEKLTSEWGFSVSNLRNFPIKCFMIHSVGADLFGVFWPFLAAQAERSYFRSLGRWGNLVYLNCKGLPREGWNKTRGVVFRMCVFLICTLFYLLSKEQWWSRVLYKVCLCEQCYTYHVSPWGCKPVGSRLEFWKRGTGKRDSKESALVMG